MADTLIVNGSGDELEADTTPNFFFYDTADDSIGPSQLLGVSMSVVVTRIVLRQPQIVLIT